MGPLSPQLQYEAIDLKKVDAYRKLYERLTHELGAWDALFKAVALMESRASLESRGAMEPQEEWDPVAAIAKVEGRRAKVLAALRQTVYHYTNTIRQLEANQKLLEGEIYGNQEDS